MGFKDVMLGKRADYTYLPGVTERSGEVAGMGFNMGKPAKSAKHLLNALDSGEDVSDVGAFAPFMQEQAADMQGIDEDFSTGGNQLLAQGGGEQMNQVNRMHELAKQRRMELTGRQMSAAIPEFRKQASDTLERRLSEKDAFRRWQQEELDRLNSQVFDRSRQGGGLLNTLVAGGAGAAGAFLGRPPCYVAMVLWGDDDPRVTLVRLWLLRQAVASFGWALLVVLYIRFGERLAGIVKRGGLTHRFASWLFNGFLTRAQNE